MKKKIIALVLTLSILFSFTAVGFLSSALSNSYHTGDYTFNFDNESDVLKTVNGSIDTQNGVVALRNGTGSDAEISATLNYQLKSNTKYSYEIKMTVSGEATSNWITPILYTANSTGVNDSVLFTIPGYGLTPSSTSATIKKGTFTTGELTADNDLLEFYMWVGANHTYTYNIDYIKIYDETEHPVNTGNYTFDFDVRKKDTLTVTNGYVANGKLVTKDDKTPWNNLTAILNYKLESNKTYAYEIIGNVSGYSNSTGLQAFLTTGSKTAADTTENGKLVGLYNPSSINQWNYPKNGALSFVGRFTTKTISEDNSFLALYLNDGTDAKFEFEKIRIFEFYTGDKDFEFEDQFEIFSLKNAKISNGKLSLKNETGGEAEISAALNYKLESNRTYSYEIKMTVTGDDEGKWVEPRWYAANPSNNSNSLIAKLDGWSAKNGQTKTINGEFNTGVISGGTDVLKFYFWIANNYQYDIEYIKLSVKEINYEPNIGDYTFDFDVEKKDVVKIQNGSVTGGKLVTKDGREQWNNLTAILNYKLESNKTYGYEITGTVSGYSSGNVQAFFTLASKTAADTSSGKLINLYYPDNLSGWVTPSNGQITLSGSFTTSTLNEENSFLALYLNDGTTAKFEFDSIKIYDATSYEVNSGDYRFEFDTAKKDTISVINGKVDYGKLATKDGKTAWNNLTAILNYKLESNKTYGYEIIGNISGYSSGNVQAFFTLASETAADTSNGKLINLYYKDNLSGWKAPANGQLTLKGEFTTKDLTEGNYYLALYLNDGTDATFEFDSIYIYDATSYPVNEGNYTFEFDKVKKDVLNSKNVSVSDSKLMLHNPTGSGAHVQAFLNYKLKSNKVYNYEFKLKVVDAGNGAYTQGGLYNGTEKATDKKLIYFMPGCDELGNVTPVVGEYTIKGKFVTPDLPEGKEYLSITFWDMCGAKLEIDSFKITESDKPEIKSGSYKFEFNNDEDVLVFSKAAVSNGKLILNNPNETGSGSRLMAVLNYQFKNDKTYTYEMKLKITDSGNEKYSQGGFYSASQTMADKKLSYFLPNCDNNGYSKPAVGEYLQKGMFNTDDLGEKNYFSVTFWDCSGATYEIDYIEIVEHEKVVIKDYTGSHTFNFDNLADMYSYNGNVEIKNGNLNLYGKSGNASYLDDFVRLPFKLESNKTYAYEIKYTATKATVDPPKNAIFAFTHSNGTKNNGERIAYVYSHYGWEELRAGMKTNSGIFRIGDVNSNNEYLVLKYGDYSGQDIYIDYITIREVDVKNFDSKSHTFNFDDVIDIYDVSGSIQLPCKDPITGQNTLALHSSALGQGTFIRFPITLEPFKYYQVSIDYRFEGDVEDLGMVNWALWPAFLENKGEDGTYLHMNSSKKFTTFLSTDDIKASKSYNNITLSFPVTEEQIADGQNYLCMTFHNANDGDAVCYIDKLTINEVDKYDIAIMANIGSTDWSEPASDPDDYQEWKIWEISKSNESSKNDNSTDAKVIPVNIWKTIIIASVCAVLVIGGILGFVVFKKKRSKK